MKYIKIFGGVMNNTFLIIAVVVVIWAVLFVIMMSFNKKRKAKSKEFIVNIRNKAVIHLYGKNLKIDGKDISQFESVTGENLEKIAAIEGGIHSFEGIFETTAVSITGKNINMKTEKLQFEVELKSGHSYSAVLYDYSPEERKEYTKEYGSTAEDIFVMPLSLYEESNHIKACLVVSCDR